MADNPIEVRGIDEVARALYAFSDKLGDRVILSAMREGAKVIQKQAKANAPRKTGRLRRNIVIRNSKINSKRRGKYLGVYLTVKTKGKADNPKNAFYGRFIEYGFTSGRGKGRFVRGKLYMDRAYNSKREAAVNLAIRSAEAGARVVARKTGLKYG